MSKFCQNCGSVMEDQETFCANCGTQNEVVAEKSDVFATIKEKLTGKNVGIIAGAVAIVLVIAILLPIILGGGAKAAAKKYYDLESKGKVGSLKSLAPKEYWEFAEEAYDLEIADVKDEYKDDFEDYKDDMKDDGIKISYKYQDKNETKKSELKKVRNYLSEKYDIDKDKIKALVVVDFTCKYTEEKDTDIATYEIYVVKIGSKWYPLNYDYDFAIDDMVSEYMDEKAWAEYYEDNADILSELGDYDFDYDDYEEYYSDVLEYYE